MSAQSDSDEQSLASDALCIGQQTPLLAIVTASDSSVQIESIGAVHFLDIPTHAVTLDSHLDNFSPSKESPQQGIPLESLSVLRV